MLTEDEERALADEVEGEAADAEMDMLKAIASSLLALKGFHEAMAGFGRLLGRLNGIAAKRREKVRRAAQDGMQAAFVADMADDVAYSKTAPQEASEAVKGASKAGELAGREAGERCAALVDGMRDHANEAYFEAVRKAAASSRTVGWDEAMRQAVAELARKGITASTHTRKDGTVVHVPVDVGIRRAMANSGTQARNAETLDKARKYGWMVEVSKSRNPRKSHHRWEGRTYTMDEFDRVVGDEWRDYNCQHRISRYVKGRKKRFEDPLKGTGYTAEKASKLTSMQRAMENDIRKMKREREVLRSQKLGTKDVEKRLRAKQAQLDALLAEHPKVLRPDARRLSIHESARRKMGKLGQVHLDNAAKTRVRAAKGRQTVSINGRVRRISNHAADRVDERKVTKGGIANAVESPLHVVDRGYNSEGQRSVKYVGRSATVVVNPDTGDVVTCWPTGSSTRRKHGADV